METGFKSRFKVPRSSFDLCRTWGKSSRNFFGRVIRRPARKRVDDRAKMFWTRRYIGSTVVRCPVDFPERCAGRSPSREGFSCSGGASTPHPPPEREFSSRARVRVVSPRSGGVLTQGRSLHTTPCARTRVLLPNASSGSPSREEFSRSGGASTPRPPPEREFSSRAREPALPRAAPTRRTPPVPKDRGCSALRRAQ